MAGNFCCNWPVVSFRSSRACSGVTPALSRASVLQKAPKPAAIITLRRIESQRDPHVRRYFIEPEAGRHDPDHGMAHAVDVDCLFEYPRIAAEPPLPQAMTQNYDPIAMRRLFFSGGLRHVLFLREETAQRGSDSEHREEIGGD